MELVSKLQYIIGRSKGCHLLVSGNPLSGSFEPPGVLIIVTVRRHIQYIYSEARLPLHLKILLQVISAWLRELCGL